MVISTAMNAGTEIVGGVNRPPEPRWYVAGTRALIAPPPPDAPEPAPLAPEAPAPELLAPELRPAPPDPALALRVAVAPEPVALVVVVALLGDVAEEWEPPPQPTSASAASSRAEGAWRRNMAAQDRQLRGLYPGPRAADK